MKKGKYTILLVDDETDILEILSYAFEKEGYKVVTASNGLEALKVLKEHNPHLLIMDVMMPKMDGIETCRQIRETAGYEDTLVMLLTARNEEYSEVAGFDAGADDYVAKPIKTRVIISRAKALLKRNKKSFASKKTITIHGLFINFEENYVLVSKEKLFLPKKEFKLLALLASQPNKVFSRDEIYKKIWGETIVVGERTLDVHIRKLRKKIGEDLIRTHKGLGYSIEE